jgi:hypothetical protein
VHALGAGVEAHLPARVAEALAPVRLLAEEEEGVVERADLLDRLATDEHARAHHDLDIARLVVLETARVERIQQASAGRELAEEEVLGREPPQRWDAAHRPLQRAVRVQQARADDGRLGIRVGVPDQAAERPLGQPGIRVQDQEIASGRDRHAGIPPGCEPEVPLLDHPCCRKAFPDHFHRAVVRAVVDDDRLLVADALEALLDPGQGVVGDDDGAGVRHVSALPRPGALPRAGWRRPGAPLRR